MSRDTGRIASALFLLFFLFTAAPARDQGPGSPLKPRGAAPPRREAIRIASLSSDSARPGDRVTIYGRGFGSSGGHVSLTGLAVEGTYWSDGRIDFIVPGDGASGFVAVRDSRGGESNRVPFKVKRDLPAGQFEPADLLLDDVGLPGAAFLVETDGESLFGVTGFERLVAYGMGSGGPYELESCRYLPQRVGDLKVYGGYLFVAGDHGLLVYSCSDLRKGKPRVTAAVAGLSCMTLDAREKSGVPIDGTLVALCEYRPRPGSDELRVPLYRFSGGGLEKLGEFTRTAAAATERRHALAIDPLNPKVYVSGYETLFGGNAYILEIDISDPAAPVLAHREETGSLLAFDMDAWADRLWTGVVATGFTHFRAYELQPGAQQHLLLDEEVSGNFGLGRTTRLKIVDGGITVGASWAGTRPDVFLLSTFANGSAPRRDADSIDWAFDVTGFPEASPDYDGKVIVADEWAGFLTYEYKGAPNFAIEHEPDYRSVVAGAMTEGLSLTKDRVYIAGRGAGPWSADRFDLADEAEWKHAAWDWSQASPQPYPVSAVCTRDDPGLGTLIAALGHEKAMAWGQKIYGILYRETAEGIEELALSGGIDPPGLYSTGIGIAWPEKDLVYMTTGTDGFRAFVVDPGAPSITIHKDCRNEGFGSDVFNGSNMALCMKHFFDGAVHRIIVGGKLGLFSGASGLTVFDVSYPQGVPDRDHPNRTITVVKETDLSCMKWKTVNHLDVTPSGLAVAATGQGLAVFHLSWIPYLNGLSDFDAWNHVKVPESAFSPWWSNSWSASFEDACFDGDETIYAVKAPEGLWRLHVAIDGGNHTHTCTARGYYPGVECGMDYNNMLHGWGDPDIPTLHHPYVVAAGGGDAYVTGWSGKVWRLSPAP